MEIVGEVVKLLGGIAGFAALIWRVVDEFGSWLRIAVEVDVAEGGNVTVLTTVDNKGNRAKDVEFACLLLAPEVEDPIVTATNVAAAVGYTTSFATTHDFLRLGAFIKKPFYCDGRAVVPLPFYYEEQYDIADETLTYRAPVDATRLMQNVAYSVRFFIFATGHLHRSTHDAFIARQSETRAS